MAGWGKVVAGAVLGVVGTVYATNEEFRKQLPQAARDLPVTVRHRFKEAVSAAREASTTRREEILRDLEEHGGSHAARPIQPEPGADKAVVPVDPVTATPETVKSETPAKPADPDATRPIPRVDEDQTEVLPRTKEQG